MRRRFQYNKNMELKNFVIYSDMDGTLLTEWSMGPYVPKRNLESITRFVNEGGSFSIASGRQYLDTLSLVPRELINSPSVHNNGALLYDCQAQQVIQKTPLPDAYKRECVEFVKHFPGCGIVASDEKHIYHLDFGDERDQKKLGLSKLHIPYEEFLEREFMKMVYVTEDEAAMEPLKAAVDAMASRDSITTMLSSPIFLECMCKGVEKGKGVKTAVELAGLGHKKLVCIGDFFNDETMLRLADIAVCPSNAPPEIQKMCQFITCHHNDGALADLIEYLEKL